MATFRPDTRRQFLKFGLALAASGSLPAVARAAKPLRIVTPFTVNGPTDTVTRILAQSLGRALQRPVYVDNLPGDSGRYGVAAFLRQANDDTLLIGHTGTHAVSPAMFSDLPYRPIEDFAPIGVIAETPTAIAANRTFPADDVAGLIAATRDPEQTVRFLHGGVGTMSWGAALMLQTALGEKLSFVSCAGSKSAVARIAAGEPGMVVDQITNIAPEVSRERLKALALADRKRSGALPGVPTTIEAGLPFTMAVWTALFARADMPAADLAVYRTAFQVALDDGALQARLDDLGSATPDAEHRSPEALHQLIESETLRWKIALRPLRSTL